MKVYLVIAYCLISQAKLFGQLDSISQYLYDTEYERAILVTNQNELADSLKKSIFEYIQYHVEYELPKENVDPLNKTLTSTQNELLVIFKYLNEGNKFFYEVGESNSAIIEYTKAYEYALKVENKSLSKESLKRILYIYAQLDNLVGTRPYQEYLKNFSALASNKNDEAWGKLFEFRFKARNNPNPKEKLDSLFVQECKRKIALSDNDIAKARINTYLTSYYVFHNKDSMIHYAESGLRKLRNSKLRLDRLNFHDINNAMGAYYVLNDMPEKSLAFLEEIIEPIGLLSASRISSQKYWKWQAQKKLNSPDQDKFELEYLRQRIELTDLKFVAQLNDLEAKYDQAKRDEIIAQQSLSLRTRNLIIVSIALAALGFISFLVFRSRLNKLKLEKLIVTQQQESEILAINALMDGEEKAKISIGRTLHDSISTLLTSSNMHIDVFKKKNQIDNNILNKAQSILDEVTDHIRSLSHNLMSNVLIKYGLHAAMEDLCEKLTNENISFRLSSNLNSFRLNQAYETKIFQIIQELSNNVLKHSQASEVDISLFKEDHQLLISVTDNGIGFKQNEVEKSTGIGINQIKARVRSMDGKCLFQTKKHIGTQVKILIPIESKLFQT